MSLYLTINTGSYFLTVTNPYIIMFLFVVFLQAFSMPGPCTNYKVENCFLIFHSQEFTTKNVKFIYGYYTIIAVYKLKFRIRLLPRSDSSVHQISEIFCGKKRLKSIAIFKIGILNTLYMLAIPFIY